jgi:hypothetical protein
MSNSNTLTYENKRGFRHWVHWQAVRRHHDYRKFCDSNAERFAKDQKLISDDEFAAMDTLIKKRFCLKSIYHYNKDFTIEECCFNQDMFKIEPVVRIFPEVSDDKPEIGGFLPKPIPDYGDFIYFGINIAENVTWTEIEKQVKRHISLARAIRKKNAIHSRFKTKADIFEVWDLINSGKSSTETIRILWPDEYQKARGRNSYLQEKEYEKLAQSYKQQGLENWDEKAYNKVYSEQHSSSMKQLHEKVRNKFSAVESLFSQFPPNSGV